MANLSGFLKKAFPFISAAASFGGPLGTLAADAVGKAIGANKLDPSEDSIASAVAGATPEQLTALKQAELDLQAKLAEMGFKDAEELAQIAAGDRDSARAREVALRDRIPAILAITITVGFFGMLAVVMHYGVQPQSEKLVDIMLGSLGAAWLSVVTYYFGSSAGSDKKTELLAGK
jgi:hypothetical protein